MEDPLVNPLLSTQKSTDSSTHVALHPLPILEISDYITRASLRGQDGPIIGALLGQQTGREATVITIEHSFSCRVTKNEDGLKTMDLVWFKDRLAQRMWRLSNPLL
jgi:COP9 signalosome complex subunit 6